MTTLKLGTRGSKLALWQSNFVADSLKKIHTDLSIELVTIKTKGDAILDKALADIGDKGLFITEIENALLDGRIDFAVHSSKDMPTTQPNGLALSAFLQRANAYDALICKTAQGIDSLPDKAIIATGSLRRKAQLLAYNPSFQIIDIRGNVDTRLNKFDSSNMDAMILAAAGLERLGLEERITELIPADIMLPAVAQGIICVETRESDKITQGFIQSLNDKKTAVCALAERAFLRRLEGGCHVPIAAFAQLAGDKLLIRGLVANEDGSKVLKAEKTAKCENAVSCGEELADELIAAGAGEILA